MGKTPIEWTDFTWNPIRGEKGRWHCTHISEGCRNCYAERLNRRWGGPEYKPGADTFRLDEKILEQPLHWMKERKVFVCDMTDFFHEQIPERDQMKIWRIMRRASQHTFQVLTKRAARMAAFLKLDPCDEEFLYPVNNIWLGVSVEDQKTADERIPLLLQTPAAVRFISYEPALAAVDFAEAMPTNPDEARKQGLIDWLIIGGESGPNARPMHPDWARSARDQCQAAGVPFFFKQWGEWAPSLGEVRNCNTDRVHLVNGITMSKIGKKKAGRLLDGREWNEFPEKEGRLKRAQG